MDGEDGVCSWKPAVEGEASTAFRTTVDRSTSTKLGSTGCTGFVTGLDSAALRSVGADTGLGCEGVVEVMLPSLACPSCDTEFSLLDDDGLDAVDI